MEEVLVVCGWWRRRSRTHSEKDSRSQEERKKNREASKNPPLLYIPFLWARPARCVAVAAPFQVDQSLRLSHSSSSSDRGNHRLKSEGHIREMGGQAQHPSHTHYVNFWTYDNNKTKKNKDKLRDWERDGKTERAMMFSRSIKSSPT